MFLLSSKCLALLVAAAQALLPTSVALADQYGRKDRLEAYSGSAVVVIVVSAQRLRKLKRWEIAIRDRYPTLRIVRIADVAVGDPPPTYEAVAERLRKRVPEEISVLIDMNRIWAAELDLDTSRPNLLVLDAEGSLRGTVRSRFSPESFAELSRTLDGLRVGP